MQWSCITPGSVPKHGTISHKIGVNRGQPLYRSHGCISRSLGTRRALASRCRASAAWNAGLPNRASWQRSTCKRQGSTRSVGHGAKASPFLAGRPVEQQTKAPRVVLLARKTRSGCVVTATVMEEGLTADRGQAVSPEVQRMLDQPLAELPGLIRGRLDNGLAYVIYPNKTPEERFEAHLQMHAGSVDEGEDQQGIAHIVEHVTFLGSAKRDAMLGTGARSNAYTDFHHTVFHYHSPLVNVNNPKSGPMLPKVLDTLAEVAFQPEFLTSRIEKERLAVLSEAQMMNSIEYRIDCALLKALHHDCALGSRFPIGLTSQVKQWNKQQIVDFWRKWYYPANATLYLFGDFGCSVEDARAQIEKSFSKVPAVREGDSLQPFNPKAANPYGTREETNGSTSLPPPLPRPEIRPPVEHIFGVGPLPPDYRPAKVDVFQHRLQQLFQLSIFCKMPVQPIHTTRDLRSSFIIRILLSVLSFRLKQRYVEANPPFMGIELDISDSSREGCAVSTLTVSSEPKDWRGAVQVAMQELRRLQKFGVTHSELDRYNMAMLRDATQAAQQADSIPSIDMLEYAMDSSDLKHRIMDQGRTYEELEHWINTITVEEANKQAASLLSFTSHYGREAEALAEAEAAPERFAPPGPTRATSIVACFPMFTDPSGESLGGGGPVQRGASMTTNMHVDPATIDLTNLEEENQEAEQEDIPEGAVRFQLGAREIEEAMLEPSPVLEAPAEVPVPDSLLSEEDLQRLIEERKPQYVPLEGAEPGASPFPPPDPNTGIVQRRLSNGIKINYWYSDNEPQSCLIRVCGAGGRALEDPAPGPSGGGAATVAFRSISESGTVGHWQREQVELFCISRLINHMLDTDEEFFFLDAVCPVGGGGLPAMLGLLHQFLEVQSWDEKDEARAKQLLQSSSKSLPKSLERNTGDLIMGAMFGPTRRFRDPGPEELNALTTEGMREVVQAQLYADNLEVNVVGDFDPQELEQALLEYLGTVSPRKDHPVRQDAPCAVNRPDPKLQHQVWHLKDSDERATAYISGKAPPRWGSFDLPEGAPLPPQDPGRLVITPQLPSLAGMSNRQEQQQQALIRQAHPMYAYTCLRLLTEVMNGRLFTTVRDTLGLTYDVSFDMGTYDRLRHNYYCIHVTSTPDKIRQAVTASANVLRSFYSSPVQQRELLRAQRTVLTRHESDLKTNAYRLGLITHLQASSVPLKDLACLRDLEQMIEAATVADVMKAYHQLAVDDSNLYTCIGTSGPEPLPPLPDAAPQPAGKMSLNGTSQGNKASAEKKELDSKAKDMLTALIASLNKQR